jgi:galactokinase
MRRIGVFVMMVVMVALLATAGCGTTGPTQADLNTVAQTAGAMAVGAYNLGDSKFTPQQKQAAKAAVAVIATIGKVNTGEAGLTGAAVQTQINQALAAQIKDPQQLSMAQSTAGTFVGVLTPLMDQATAKYGSAGAIQVFMAFCKGVSSVPIN